MKNSIDLLDSPNGLTKKNFNQMLGYAGPAGLKCLSKNNSVN